MDNFEIADFPEPIIIKPIPEAQEGLCDYNSRWEFNLDQEAVADYALDTDGGYVFSCESNLIFLEHSYALPTEGRFINLNRGKSEGVQCCHYLPT